VSPGKVDRVDGMREGPRVFHEARRDKSARIYINGFEWLAEKQKQTISIHYVDIKIYFSNLTSSHIPIYNTGG